MFASINPQYDKRLFMELPCSSHLLLIFCACSFHGNSMNNLLSYCGLIDARISASEKDLSVSSILDEKASQKWEAFEVLTYLRAILNFFFKVSCKVGPSVRTSFHTSSNADESNVVRRFADATNTLGAIHILRKHLKGRGGVKRLSLFLIFSTKNMLTY